MNIVVNGENVTCPEGLTVRGLLLELKLLPDAIVVAWNDTILQRSTYDSTPVSEGDSLELIQFVGGG